MMTTPPEASTQASPLAELVVREVIQVLRAVPELAAAARSLFSVGTESTHVVESAKPPPAFMSVREYAKHARVSDRTIRDDVKYRLQEGVHFHRDGKTGRRVVIHVEPTDAWRASRSWSPPDSVTQLVDNELLRRQAQRALKRTKGK